MNICWLIHTKHKPSIVVGPPKSGRLSNSPSLYSFNTPLYYTICINYFCTYSTYTFLMYICVYICVYNLLYRCQYPCESIWNHQKKETAGIQVSLFSGMATSAEAVPVLSAAHGSKPGRMAMIWSYTSRIKELFWSLAGSWNIWSWNVSCLELDRLKHLKCPSKVYPVKWS